MEHAENGGFLVDCHTFRDVSRLVYIMLQLDRHVVGEKLQGDCVHYCASFSRIGNGEEISEISDERLRKSFMPIGGLGSDANNIGSARPNFIHGVH